MTLTTQAGMSCLEIKLDNFSTSGESSNEFTATANVRRAAGNRAERYHAVWHRQQPGIERANGIRGRHAGYQEWARHVRHDYYPGRRRWRQLPVYDTWPDYRRHGHGHGFSGRRNDWDS